MKYLFPFLLILVVIAPLTAFETGKSPLRASLSSFAVSGGGQAYNGKYIKAVLFFGSEAYFIGQVIYSHNKMQDYSDKAYNSIANSPEFLYYESKYNSYYNDRQNAYWWLGTTIFVSVIDAFVDAHLYNYEEKKRQLHMQFMDKKLSLVWKF
ncbi:MAG: hypothetical protein K8S56_04785 [Candidatus Cloacimonetes bacterium]|nr:hypothetical protein [Candidatus Cloacimonadota bacterium]